MPLSFIDIFRPQLDPTAQLVGTGVSVLTSALKDSVQIGRDMANLRATQEKEYLVQKEAEANRAARRAEFLTTQKNVDRSFYEDVFRDERDTNIKTAVDARNFDYKVTEDAKNFALNSMTAGSTVAANNERVAAAQETRAAIRDQKAQDRLYASTRVGDILGAPDAPAPDSYASIFSSPTTGQPWSMPNETRPAPVPPALSSPGIPATPAPTEPEVLESQAKELRRLGTSQRNPQLTAAADVLEQQAAGVKQQRKLDAAAAIAARPRGKAPVPLDDQIAKLEIAVKAGESTISAGDKGKLARDETTAEFFLKHEQNKLLLEALRAKKAAGSDTVPDNTPAEPVPGSLEYYLQKVKRK